MKEINIDTRKLMKAPIDDKNVMSDWLTDALFDNEEYTFNKNEYLGFVSGFPTFMSYRDNVVEMRFLKLPKSADDRCAWRGTIIERLTDVAYDELWCLGFTFHIQFIDDKACDSDGVHVLTFDAVDDFVSIKFHWNVPR